MGREGVSFQSVFWSKRLAHRVINEVGAGCFIELKNHHEKMSF